MTETSTKSSGGERPPWKAKIVWVALALMLIGGGLWIKDYGQADNLFSATSPGTPQFSYSSTTGAPVEKQSELKPSAPATFRFGASYVGGYSLDWTFCRFLKLT